MHYYQHHIGDYRRDTTHFSMLEHGAYRQLLDWLYLDQKPIPIETEVVFRRLRAITDDEKLAVETVLKEKFELTDHGYIQHRVLQEIEVYKKKADIAKENGKSGGRPKKTNPVISGMLNETKEKANQEPLTNNHKPLLEDQKHIVPSDAGDLFPLPEKSSKPDCPHQEIIAIYHEVLPQCPRIRDWTPARATQLRARWNEDEKRQSLDWWRKFFEYIAGCDFLVGRTPKPYFASLEWIVKTSNFVKIREGNYENRSQN